MSVVVQAFLVCKSVVIDEGSRVADVEGIFDAITVSSFPATHRNCALFVRLLVWDEVKCTLSVDMLAPSLARRRIIKPTLVKPDPNGKVKVTCRIDRLSFAEEGIHTLLLQVNETTHSEFHLTAIKRRPRRSTPERGP